MMDYRDMEKAVCEAPTEPTIAMYVEGTANNLKESQILLDKIFDNMFGPRPSKEPVNRPPIECLEQEIALNAEGTAVLKNRLEELLARVFGR